MCCEVLFPQRSTAQAVNFTESLNLYKTGKYEEAAAGLSACIQADPKNIDACTYLANCYFQMRKKSEAIVTYWYIVRNFPTNKRAFEIREFLKRNDSQYAQHAGDASFGTRLLLVVAKGAGGGDTAANIKRNSVPVRSKAEIVSELVKTIRPLKGRPAVSNSMVGSAHQVLQNYPEGLLRLMSARRIRVCLTPTTIDHNPSVENTQPRGYEDGTTFKDCPGFFNGQELVVCEYTIGNGFDVHRLDDPMGTLRHEMGHCIDQLLGNVTNSEEFKHAYYLDTGAINDEGVRNRISYYLQKASGGPSEAFAELCCYKYGGRGGDYRQGTCALLHQNMKLTTAIIDRKLGALE